MSAAAHATTYTVGAAVDAVEPLEIGEVLVGCVAGAVNVPFDEIVPQLGLQVTSWGSGVVPAGKSVVLFATGCTTFHCGLALAGETFKKLAVNCTCCAGLISVGTVAVDGVTDTRMPVSSVNSAVPFLFLAASAAAVNVIVGMGFGKFDNVGAV
jgi:hypothetical protein